jgi:hypothetical protein
VLLLAPAVVAALLLTAAPAGAATLSAPSCVGYHPNTRTLPVEGAGFAPGSFVSVRYEAPQLGVPRSAALVTADPAGSFSLDLVPPSPGSLRVNTSTFTISAVDPLQPSISAADEFMVTRVRVDVVPRASTNPARRARFTAFGFVPGSVVYAHFLRFGAARAEKTVSLGRARGACGRVSKRMALVPGRNVARGSWELAVDAKRSFSRSTRPQAGEQILIQRRPPRPRR